MKRFFLFALFCACIYSCQKNYNSDPGVETYASYAAAMATQAPKAKRATVNTAVTSSIRGNSGARYTFQPNSFVNQYGVPVTGDVQIEMTEYVTKADMLFSGVLPQAEDGPLESGGEAEVNVSQNGERLMIAPGVNYEVMLPYLSSPASDMKLFLGEEDPVTNMVNWRPAIDFADSVSNNGDSFRVQTGNVGLINADRYFQFTPCHVSFKLQYKGFLVNDSFSVYIVVKGRNIIYRTKKPENGMINNVLVQNSNVSFLAVGFIENSLCACAIQPPVSEGATYTLDVLKITPSKLRSLISYID